MGITTFTCVSLVILHAQHTFRSSFYAQQNTKTNTSHGNTHIHLCALVGPFAYWQHTFRSSFYAQQNTKTNTSHGNTHFHLCALVGPFAYWAMHSTRTSKHDVAPTLRRTYASAHPPTHTTRAAFIDRIHTRRRIRHRLQERTMPTVQDGPHLRMGCGHKGGRSSTYFGVPTR